MIIQALRKGLIEHEASDTGGVPRWQSFCPDRLAEATLYTGVEDTRYLSVHLLRSARRNLCFDPSKLCDRRPTGKLIVPSTHSLAAVAVTT